MVDKPVPVFLKKKKKSFGSRRLICAGYTTTSSPFQNLFYFLLVQFCFFNGIFFFSFGLWCYMPWSHICSIPSRKYFTGKKRSHGYLYPSLNIVALSVLTLKSSLINDFYLSRICRMKWAKTQRTPDNWPKMIFSVCNTIKLDFCLFMYVIVTVYRVLVAIWIHVYDT